MSTLYLELTPHDPLIARDGRPFGINQGRRMRALPWLLPSVVAGSLRTALVKASGKLDFAGDMPQRLLEKVHVAGVFPVSDGQLYLPAPQDAVAAPKPQDAERIQALHRATPQEIPEGGGDFPVATLRPVMLTPQQAMQDFKPAKMPAWWPLPKYTAWLTQEQTTWEPDFFDACFLQHPVQEIRDHVRLDPNRGAATEGHIFATAQLNVNYLPRYRVPPPNKRSHPHFHERYGKVVLTVRVVLEEGELQKIAFRLWHPLGGERRLVHWQQAEHASLWQCPDAVKQVLSKTEKVRMVLATPAIFKDGWKPGWLNEQLEGMPPGSHVRLRLVGVTLERWRAVSGWSLAPINDRGQLDPNGKRGPKPVRRYVPAGGVYFFEVVQGNAHELAELWLQPVSDEEQERRDGFGLALWGSW
jgi:CRISPR-associated protein Cmr3